MGDGRLNMAERKTIRQQAIDFERQKGRGEQFLTREELARFEEEWAKMMVDIWREKIERLRAVRSGALYSSFGYNVTGETGRNRTISHRFLMYGIMVERGVGPAHAWQRWTRAQGAPPKVERSNEGDLDIMNPTERESQGMNRKRRVGPAWGGYETSGEPRERREWFSRRYYASIMKLNEHEAKAIGEQYMGTMFDALNVLFGGSALRVERYRSGL